MNRKFTTCILDDYDDYVFCGTTTGDILEIDIKQAAFKRLAPVGKNFSLGVLSISIHTNGDLVVGAGDGTIAKVSI